MIAISSGLTVRTRCINARIMFTICSAFKHPAQLFVVGKCVKSSGLWSVFVLFDSIGGIKYFFWIFPKILFTKSMWPFGHLMHLDKSKYAGLRWLLNKFIEWTSNVPSAAMSDEKTWKDLSIYSKKNQKNYKNKHFASNRQQYISPNPVVYQPDLSKSSFSSLQDPVLHRATEVPLFGRLSCSMSFSCHSLCDQTRCLLSANSSLDTLSQLDPSWSPTLHAPMHQTDIFRKKQENEKNEETRGKKCSNIGNYDWNFVESSKKVVRSAHFLDINPESCFQSRHDFKSNWICQSDEQNWSFFDFQVLDCALIRFFFWVFLFFSRIVWKKKLKNFDQSVSFVTSSTAVDQFPQVCWFHDFPFRKENEYYGVKSRRRKKPTFVDHWWIAAGGSQLEILSIFVFLDKKWAVSCQKIEIQIQILLNSANMFQIWQNFGTNSALANCIANCFGKMKEIRNLFVNFVLVTVLWALFLSLEWKMTLGVHETPDFENYRIQCLILPVFRFLLWFCCSWSWAASANSDICYYSSFVLVLCCCFDPLRFGYGKKQLWRVQHSLRVACPSTHFFGFGSKMFPPKLLEC